MKFLIVGIFFVLQIRSSVAVLGCPDGTVTIPDGLGTGNWSCLLLASYPEPYLIAEQTCNLNNGYLITVPNGYVNIFVSQTAKEVFGINKESTYWIGVNDLLGFGWTNSDNGSQTTFFDWAPGQPINDTSETGCVSVDFYGLWYNDNCYEAYPYVCEVPKVEITTPAPTKPTTTPSLSCDPEWMKIDDQCYKLIVQNATISEAEIECKNLGNESHIASIHNYQTSVTLGFNLTAKVFQAAIGLCSNFYTGNEIITWSWADYTPFDYVHWGDNEPQLSTSIPYYCAALNIDGTWSSHDAIKPYSGYICQKPL